MSAISFDVQVYGNGGGVMFAYQKDGPSAMELAVTEAKRWAGYPQARTVGVWACDRRSGHAQHDIPERLEEARAALASFAQHDQQAGTGPVDDEAGT